MSADGARKLFVGGLADSTTDVELRAVFENAGFQVEHLALPRDRDTGRLRGFAFITLSNEEEANRARSELQGADCSGRPLSIREFSQEPPKRGAGAPLRPGGPPRPGGAPRERGPGQEEPTVFLGKLPFESTAEEIQQLFAAQGVGPVARVTLPLGPDGRPRGFGFATLPSQEQVDQAVAKVNGATLRGRQIVVSPAQPKGAAGGPGVGRGRPPTRHSDRPPGGGYDFGERGSFDGGGMMDPPVFPPNDAKGAGRRREGAKKERRDKRRGGSSGAGESWDSSQSGGAGGRGARKKRGGGSNWHQWESDDE